MKFNLLTEEEKKKPEVIFAWFPVKAYSEKDQRYKIIWLEEVIRKRIKSLGGWINTYKECRLNKG